MISRVLNMLRLVYLNLSVFIAMMIVLNALLWALIEVKHLFEDRGQAVSVEKVQPWKSLSVPEYMSAEEFWEDYTNINGVHFEPYYYWRRDAYASRHVNVLEGGIRKTIKSPVAGAKKVFVLGGSTVWGTRVPDVGTLPSFLQKRLGPQFDVYNLGESGFVSTQEIAYLQKLLADGSVPDIVVCYDGVNDTRAGTYTPAVPRDPSQVRERFKQGRRQEQQGNKWVGLIKKLLEGTSLEHAAKWVYLKINGVNYSEAQQYEEENAVREGIPENSVKTVEYYLENVKLVKALGAYYGFETFFFWQPVLVAGEREPVGHEVDIFNQESEVLVEAFRMTYEVAKRRFSGEDDVVYCADALASIGEPLYLDYCHLGLEGNRMMADVVYEELRRRSVYLKGLR